MTTSNRENMTEHLNGIVNCNTKHNLIDLNEQVTCKWETDVVDKTVAEVICQTADT